MAKYSFPVNALRSGEFYESDLFVEKEFLLRQGHRVTPALLIMLKRQGIKDLYTRLPSLAERMSERINVLPTDFRTQLANNRDKLLGEFGVTQVLPTELYNEVVSLSAMSFKEAGEGKLEDFGDLWRAADSIANNAVYTGKEVLKPLDVPDPEVYYSYHSVNVAIIMTSALSDICNSVGKTQTALGCLMHDLGKATVPKEILFKHGTLTAAEFEKIKTHIEHSTRLLFNSGEVHAQVKGMVSSHHEKYNGTGYPDGLIGADIPYLGRWMSVCDVFDALTTSRVYQQRIAPPIAMELLVQCAGSQFDPDCARGLVERLGTYPVGSYLLLKDNRIGLVVRNYTNGNSVCCDVGIIDFTNGDLKADDKLKITSKSDVIDTFDI